mgnify:FL=1
MGVILQVIMGCVIGLIIGCAHDRVIMSDLLIELSCMQDWPGAQETVQEILKEDEQKKEKLHEQEVQQEEENRQSS